MPDMSGINPDLQVPERGARRGFTLLEVLVAAGITALIAGFCAIIVSNVGSFWTRTSGRLSAEAQARYALDLLSLDLSGARFRDDGNTWLAATFLSNTTNTSGLWLTTGTATTQKPGSNVTGTGASLQFTATISNSSTTLSNLGDNSTASPRFGIGGTWLRFFTTKRGTNDASSANNTATTESAPVAVAYQIVRRRTSTSTLSTDIRYLLHRSEVRPARNGTTASSVGTFETGYTITAAGYGPVSNSVAVGDPGEIKYPTLSSVIADNVIDLGVRFYVRDATATATNGLRLVFPATNSATNYLAKTPSSVAGATDAFPDVVDVMVRVLTDEGARLIAAYEANPSIPSSTTLPTGVTAQQYWWQIAIAHSQVFTRRIVVNAQPL